MVLLVLSPSCHPPPHHLMVFPRLFGLEQGAVAFAAAKRGPGEREQLVASESPVEEFVVRGRRVLVKRDDKVHSSMHFVFLVSSKGRSCYVLGARLSSNTFSFVFISLPGKKG